MTLTGNGSTTVATRKTIQPLDGEFVSATIRYAAKVLRPLASLPNDA